ncbi:hypothetical protein SAMN06295885_1548 [Rathayibacter oskolensis]|uniref:Acetone carboxylase n=1 Tax=Rathayibacter oskolensis TaxID=1891671 RepID=A0A1X7NNN9_9MICO|nr:hypothetical protein [Rathayibacter oskolensis]SMH38827.1 hypothetical protein SAMN06295885_1548 [Rathayibacter oskolensis]
MISLGSQPEAQTCSRAGCTLIASWALEWRNPRIHTEDRRKTWLACGEHLDYLREFLAAREFPLEVKPLHTLDKGTAR